jgi:hypothetical protein
VNRETLPPQIEPVTFRLPPKGVDPHFGFTRSWYYQAEVEGRLELIRMRSRGKNRGVTLVPYAAVKALIEQEKFQAVAEAKQADARRLELVAA